MPFVRILGLLWLLDIAAAALLARRDGRNAIAWISVAAVTGPLAVLTLLALPRKGQRSRVTIDFVMVTSIILIFSLSPVGAARARARHTNGPGPDTGAPGLELFGLLGVGALGGIAGAAAGLMLAPLVACGQSLRRSR